MKRIFVIIGLIAMVNTALAGLHLKCTIPEQDAICAFESQLGFCTYGMEIVENANKKLEIFSYTDAALQNKRFIAEEPFIVEPMYITIGEAEWNFSNVMANRGVLMTYNDGALWFGNMLLGGDKNDPDNQYGTMIDCR